MILFHSLKVERNPSAVSSLNVRGILRVLFIRTMLRYVHHVMNEPTMANGAALWQSFLLKACSSSALVKLHRQIEHSKMYLVIPKSAAIVSSNLTIELFTTNLLLAGAGKVYWQM